MQTIKHGLPDSRKEQIKLRATFINGIALIFFSIGVLAPIVSSIYVKDISPDRALLAALTALICFIATVALHLAASHHLKEMDQ